MIEFMNLPNWISHTLYKEYIEWLQDENAQKAASGEAVAEQIQNAVTGGN